MKTATGIFHNAGSKCLTARYLHATLVHPTDTWCIRKSIQTHTCHGIHHTGHRNVKVEFISMDILPKVRTDRSITPTAIQNHFKDFYSIDIGYDKAYRAKQHAIQFIDGSHAE